MSNTKRRADERPVEAINNPDTPMPMWDAAEMGVTKILFDIM